MFVKKMRCVDYFSGKHYRFYYDAKSLQCRSNFLCSEPGLTQQKVFADYVHNALDKLKAEAFGSQPNHQFNQNLPELVLIEGNLQVAMKPDESLSPSLFTFRSHFAAIHRD